jgi:aminopeptidase-like protein
LGKRRLYSSIRVNELALLWMLDMPDGNNTLPDIAERSGIKFAAIKDAEK